MKKTKKVQLALPKNIQLTLITLAAITFVVQAFYHGALLLRVYPEGIRFSQFTFMMLTYVLLPAVLFGIAFVATRKTSARFDRVFQALLLTITGLGIYSIVFVLDRVLSLYTALYQHSLFINGGMIALPLIVTLVLFASLLYFLRDNHSPSDKKLQQVVITILGLAYIGEATFNVVSLILRHVGSKNIMNFLTHPELLMPVVLPLAFFATAYLALQRTNTLERIFKAFLYATAGVIVITITLTLFHTYVWILAPRDSASIFALDLPTLFAAIVSIAVYAFLIITHNRSEKRTKKTK